METVTRIAEIVGYTFSALVFLGAASLILWYLIRGRYRRDVQDSETERLRPYEEAATGYKLQVEQLKGDIERLTSDLRISNDDRTRLRIRVKELEADYLALAQTNQKQQGQIDQMKRQIEDLGDLKLQLLELMRELKA